MRRLLRLILAAALCVGPGVVEAQSPMAVPARVGPAPCTYERCALRVAESMKPRRRWLVQGVAGDSSRVEFTAASLAAAVREVPAAATEAQRANAWFRAGGFALGASLVTAVALAIGPTRQHNPTLTLLATTVIVLPVPTAKT